MAPFPSPLPTLTEPAVTLDVSQLSADAIRCAGFELKMSASGSAVWAVAHADAMHVIAVTIAIHTLRPKRPPGILLFSMSLAI